MSSTAFSHKFSEAKNEILAGLTTSFAMIPEVVAFAFVAGLNPLVGLYGAFTIGLLTSIFGGRPGMISGAAGSLAVVCVTLVAAHGPEKGPQYLFATLLVMGIIQALIGIFKWGKFAQLVPHPVMLGFVNGLAIVIFMAQLRHFRTPDATGALHYALNPAMLTMAILVGVTMLITWLLPKITKVIPSSLAAILIVTGLTHLFHLQTRMVGDLASVHGGLPKFNLPEVPFTLETLGIILPYAVVLAAVGLTETLLTLTLIDQLTETKGDSNQECIGQGIANFVTGFFGGMGGCAMIGQCVMNITSGGRKRLSGIAEALSILLFIVIASRQIEQVPMAALVGVMFVVVIKTFAWSSLRILHKIPRWDAFVLVTVSLITVFTNLAYAVFAGIILCALKFAWINAMHMDARRYEEDGQIVYEIHGPLFFGSVQRFLDLFTPPQDTERTIVSFRYAHLYDHSALDALTQLAERYTALGKELHLRNVSEQGQRLLNRADNPTGATLCSTKQQHISTERLS